MTNEPVTEAPTPDVLAELAASAVTALKLETDLGRAEPATVSDVLQLVSLGLGAYTEILDALADSVIHQHAPDPLTAPAPLFAQLAVFQEAVDGARAAASEASHRAAAAGAAAAGLRR